MLTNALLVHQGRIGKTLSVDHDVAVGKIRCHVGIELETFFKLRVVRFQNAVQKVFDQRLKFRLSGNKFLRRDVIVNPSDPVFERHGSVIALSSHRHAGGREHVRKRDFIHAPVIDLLTRACKRVPAFPERIAQMIKGIPPLL